MNNDSASSLESVLLGTALCLVNIFLGWLVARYSFRKKFEKAIGLVIGSMAVRLFLSGAMVWFVLAEECVEPLGFVLSFAVGSFIFLFVEVLYFHFQSDKLR